VYLLCEFNRKERAKWFAMPFLLLWERPIPFQSPLVLPPQKIAPSENSPSIPYQPTIQTPLLATNTLFPVNPVLCFFFASSSLFFFPPTIAPHQQRLTLYTATLNDEHRVTLSFPPPSPSLSECAAEEYYHFGYFL
jgi:hypothetical protein